MGVALYATMTVHDCTYLFWGCSVSANTASLLTWHFAHCGQLWASHCGFLSHVCLAALPVDFLGIACDAFIKHWWWACSHLYKLLQITAARLISYPLYHLSQYCGTLRQTACSIRVVLQVSA